MASAQSGGVEAVTQSSCPLGPLVLFPVESAVLFGLWFVISETDSRVAQAGLERAV